MGHEHPINKSWGGRKGGMGPVHTAGEMEGSTGDSGRSPAPKSEVATGIVVSGTRGRRPGGLPPERGSK